MLTKKASTIWKEMSEEDKKPWVEKNAQLKEEAGQSPSSSPASDWNFEKKVDVEVPEGWSGPHLGKYLAKSAAKGRGVGRFATFEEAVAAAEALGNKCGGITLEQKAYTVRVGNDPIKHPNPAQSTYSEASWTKDNFEPELAPKSPKASKKKTAKAEEPKPDEVKPEAEPEAPLECQDGHQPDCNGLCTDSLWIGDGFCDDPYEGHHLNCPELNNDGGDCADGNAAEFRVDCLGHRAPASWFGDGACDNGIYQHNGH